MLKSRDGQFQWVLNRRLYELLLHSDSNTSLYIFPSLSPLHRPAPAPMQSDTAEFFRCGIEKDLVTDGVTFMGYGGI